MFHKGLAVQDYSSEERFKSEDGYSLEEKKKKGEEGKGRKGGGLKVRGGERRKLKSLEKH